MANTSADGPTRDQHSDEPDDTMEQAPSGPDLDTPLTEHDQQYRAIFEVSSDGLIISDLETAIVLEANPAACRMHGYHQMSGLHPSVFIHPDHRHLVNEFTNEIRAGRDYQRRAQHVRQDGSMFDVEVRGQLINYHGKAAMLVVIRDITDQVRAYQILEQRVVERTREIERRREVAEGLRDLLAAINSQPTLDKVLEYVVAQSRRLLNSDASAIFLPDDERRGLVLSIRASSGLADEFHDVKMPVDSSSTGVAFTRRRAVAIPDLPDALPPLSGAIQEFAFEDVGSHINVTKLPSSLESPEREARYEPVGALRPFASGYGSFLAVPLAVKEETYGALSLYFQAPRIFTDDDIGLASVFADQAALAIENARLRAHAEQAAADEERQRLARDLHDAVTQTIFSASLIAEVIPDLWDVDPDEAKRRLEQLRKLTRGALAEMRILLVELRPGALTALSLPDLLRQLTEAAAGNIRTEVELTVNGSPSAPLPPEVQMTFYRITQEALNNIAKHSQARQAAIALDYAQSGDIELRICDDGRGFDMSQIPVGHLGVSIMRERAEAIGAEFQVESETGAGTLIAVRWRHQAVQ